MSGPPQVIYPVQIRMVADEELTGIIDGVNFTFTTQYNYISGTLVIYLNGLKQKSGATFDYVEIDDTTIQMNYAPLPGDIIIAEYLRKT